MTPVKLSRTSTPARVALGDGHDVPYPSPSSATATSVGRGNTRTGTKPEVRLRSALHRRGLRFRKDHPIRTPSRLVRPDVVFTGARVAVFVDGCFWHGCPQHQRIPKTNTAYWVPKLARNVERDRLTDSALIEAGWRVVRLWEHQDPESAAQLVEGIVRGGVPGCAGGQRAAERPPLIGLGAQE